MESDMIKNLKDFFNSEKGKQWVLEEKERNRIKNEKTIKLIQYLETVDDFDERLFKLLERERVIQDYYYKVKHCFKNSNIFNFLFETLSKIGEEYDCDDDFFGFGFTYKGFTFKVYQGQGSFITIEKGDFNFTTS